MTLDHTGYAASRGGRPVRKLVVYRCYEAVVSPPVTVLHPWICSPSDITLKTLSLDFSNIRDRQLESSPLLSDLPVDSLQMFQYAPLCDDRHILATS